MIDPMEQSLWAGPDLKVDYAAFHYGEIAQALDPPRNDAYYAAQVTAGMIVGHPWQRRLYAHFDAFLSAARSVPEVIQCCFGVDEGHPKVKAWLKTLAAAERARRVEFTKQFEPAYNRFRQLPLSNTRHIIEHRTGVAPVEVTVNTYFGVTYVGGPTKRVPDSHTPTLRDEDQWMAQPRPVPLPNWADFKVDGQPLFHAMQEYLRDAGELVKAAREIALRVHGADTLTAPPP